MSSCSREPRKEALQLQLQPVPPLLYWWAPMLPQLYVFLSLTFQAQKALKRTGMEKQWPAQGEESSSEEEERKEG